jgi:hypothetical protein
MSAETIPVPDKEEILHAHLTEFQTRLKDLLDITNDVLEGFRQARTRGLHLQLVTGDAVAGKLMACNSCGDAFEERRSEHQPGYGLCSEKCYLQEHPEAGE